MPMCAPTLSKLASPARHTRKRLVKRATVRAVAFSLFNRNFLGWPLRSAASDAETEVSDPAAGAFSHLLEQAGLGAGGNVALRQSATRGRALYTKEEVPAAGTTLLAVPLDICIVVDYARGGRVELPPGRWPRLNKGVAKDDSLPWDILQALALLDALAGDGGAFWERYANEVLPEPLVLALPMCLPEPLLRQLGHPSIEEAALRQQQRLLQLFPGLASPMCEGGPTFLQWALACVRSRAFQLSPDCFAFVPFLDVANHAAEPNANFQLEQPASAAQGEVRLRALAPVPAGAEVTISYTGEGGYTNERLYAQYGFVPRHGNPYDRLQFDCLKGAAPEARLPGLGAKPGDAGRPDSDSILLSLDGLQSALGDGKQMLAAFSGRDTYLYAAVKSMPLAAMESDAAPLADQLRLAEQLLREVEADRAAWASSISEDEAELVRVVGQAAEGQGDARLPAVVRYRLQRKRLVDAAERVLRAFLHL